LASAGTLIAQIVDPEGQSWTMVSYEPSKSKILLNPALTLTVLPLDSDETAIIVSALADDKNAMLNLKRFDELSYHERLLAITRLMTTSNKENTFLHPDLWDHLSKVGVAGKIVDELTQERGNDLLVQKPSLSSVNLFAEEYSCSTLKI